MRNVTKKPGCVAARSARGSLFGSIAGLGLGLGVVALCAGVSGCAKLGDEPAAAAQSNERSRDFVRLDPKSPRLDFIKVEVVKESDGAGKITLPGRVTFDEDH